MKGRRTFVGEFGGILGSCVRSTKQYQQTCQKHVSRRAPHLEAGGEDQVLFESSPPPPPALDRHPRGHSTDPPPRALLPINRDLFSTSGVSLRRRSRSAGNESTPDTFSTIDATTRRSGGRTSSPNLPARNVPLHSSLFSSCFARSTQHVLVISRGAYEIF